jgi:hypothetical protein
MRCSDKVGRISFRFPFPATAKDVAPLESKRLLITIKRVKGSTAPVKDPA